jgi:subtilase family serine protease
MRVATQRDSRLTIAASLIIGLLFSLPAFAQSVTKLAPTSALQIHGQVINESQVVTLKGHVRPFLAAATDQGRVDDGQKVGPIMLMLSRTPQQQQNLDSLVDDLHNRNSASYHNWLTPAQFGAHFQPADEDVAAVKAWLQSKGFNVLDVVPSKTFISFTGTAGQLRNAFQVEIHHVSINGENHVAAVNDPKIPAALASVIGGFNKLDDFSGKPLVQQFGAFKKDLKTGKSVPVPGTTTGPVAGLTGSESGSTFYEVGPQDFYTIYNENPLLTAGITGAGQTIAVIEEVEVATADVTSFRALFGLPTYPGTPNATQGGVNYIYGTASGLNGYASCLTPVSQSAGKTSGEESEADIDLQWAGTVAPKAIVDLVACGGTNGGDGSTPGALGIDHSAQYIANYLSSTVVAASMSYGECEADLNSTELAYYKGQWEQFAAEGITAIVSSGDGGAEQCYQNDAAATSLAPGVNGFGASAYNISAGGTDFGDLYVSNNYATTPVTTWWNATNGTGESSAVTYVPETTWGGYCSNELYSSFLQKVGSTTYGTNYTPWGICNNRAANTASLVAVVGGAGGVSTYTTIPSYQSVYGVGLNNVSTTYRNIPDVSFFASNGWWGHFLPYCESDAYACTLADYVAGDMGAGGTSFVAPQLAGLMALINQKTGSRQGQADYTFYNLAAQEYGTPGNASSTLTACSGSNVATGTTPPSSCYFYDISNDMASLQGGTITPGNYQPCYSTATDCYYATNTKSSGNTHIYGVNQAPGTTANTDVLGFLAGPGYDDATGLGSLNINGVVNGWNNVSAGFTSTTALTSTSLSLTSGAPTATLTGTVTATQRGGVPGGSVSFYLGTSNSGTLLGTGTLTGACTGTGATTACTASGSYLLNASSLQSGNNNVVAYFGGDGANDAPSTSSVVVINNATSAPAAILTPASGSVLTAASTTITWTASGYTTPVYLWIGSTPGGLDLVNVGPLSGTSTTVTLPTTGATVYATLWSTVGGSLVSTTATYTEALLAATIQTPASGSTLTGPSTTFTWVANQSTTPDYLWIGSTPGAYDLVNTSASGNTATVALPTSGNKVYVTLWSTLAGNLVSSTATYTEATLSAATISSPASGGLLTGPQTTFTFSANGSSTPMYLWIGSTSGAYDLVNIQVSGSATVTLPTAGNTVYATLWSTIGSNLVSSTATYTESTLSAATIQSPSNGSVLTGASTTLTWNTNGSTSPQYLWIGSTSGAYDLVNVQVSGTSATVTLPTTGASVYVTLWSTIGGNLVSSTATYTEASVLPATISSPSNGSTVSGSTTFTWVANQSTAPVYLWVGSTPGAYDVVNDGPFSGTTATETLPTDGSPLYVTLWSTVNGNLVSTTVGYNGAASPDKRKAGAKPTIVIKRK